MKKLTRGLLTGVVGVSGLLLTVACSGTTEEGGDTEANADGELRTVTISAPPTYNALTLHVADQEGYFEEAGLEIELVSTVGAEAVPQLLGGSIDFMLGDMVTLVRGASEGLPLAIATPNVMLDEPGAEDAYAKILISADDVDELQSPADIEGKTFGIPSINSQPWLDVIQAVEEDGGDPDTIEFVEVPNPLQALNQGQVDFVTAPDPTGTMGILDGDVALLAPLGLEGVGGTVGFPYMMTTELAESDPELVEAFRGAVIQANTLINEDRDRALEVAATYLEVPEEALQESVVPQLGEEMPTEEVVQMHIDRVVEGGIINEADAPDASAILGE